MKKNQFSSVSPAIWALFAVLIAVAGMIGYVVGHNSVEHPTTVAHNDTSATPKQVETTSAKPTGTPAAAGSAPIAALSDPAKIDATIFGSNGDVTSEADVLNVHRRNAADPFAYGAIDAPVVISEFSDFECPFCARHANTTYKNIVEDYVKKGLVRIEWNDFPINGDHAVAAAKAGRAAAAQGKFYEFKAALFTASASISGHPENTIDDFVEFAKQAGVADLDRFRAEATDDTYSDAITNARDYAAAIGLTGTPGSLVGTQFVNGAQPYDVFKQIIDEELIKANAKN